ncbi:MAG: hypothetical protein DHS20C17_02130 [Cyclobacteriaceae bacterium]|nr:MAG: hypothetical protein DHS20C17_02130 [Cyclobacteriaceae bacterium]
MYHFHRIAKARNVRGVTQTELAKMINLPHSTLNFIENGKVELKDDVVFQIASALRFPVAYFKKSGSTSRISKFFYRKRHALPAKKIVPLEAKIDIMREMYIEFLDSVDIYFRELPKIPVTENTSPEDIAKSFRLFLNLDDNPIEKPISLVEKLGIPIIYFDVDSDKFSGMTIDTDINMPMIVVNCNMSNDHIIHTIFHEIGHLIMHIPFSGDPEFYDKFEDLKSVEKEADWFSGAFLVPEVTAKYTFNPFTYSNLTNLKLYWKVSKSSLIMRAKQLKIIAESKAKTLFIELSRYGERKKEKTPISIDYPILMNRIIEYHKSELGLSYEEIAEEIGGITKSDFIDWFNLPRKGMISLN